MTFFLMAALTLFAAQGGADFEASASLDRGNVSLGRCVLLFVEAAGPAAADCEITRFPAVEGLFAERVSSRVYARKSGEEGAAGGAPVLVARFTYRLYPLRPGAFAIPPVEVTARGRKKALTRPLALTVRSGKKEGERAASLPAPGLTVSFRGETSLYWHEPLFIDRTVTLPAAGDSSEVRLYLPWLGRRRGLVRLKAPRIDAGAARLAIPVIQTGCKEDFALEPAASGGGQEVRCRGTDVMIPLEEGTVDFGPAFIAWGSGAAGDSVRYRLAETPSLDVRGLPAEGQPPSFSGGVGKFSLSVVVEPRRVRVGDSLSLRFTVRGEPWNLEFLDLPDLPELAGSFRIFGTKEGREAGPGGLAAKWRFFDLSPLSTAVTRVPSLEFSYFDPGEGKYETLVWKGIPIEVLPGEGAGPPGAGVRQAAEDIGTIIERMPPSEAWMENAAFLLAAAGFLSALIAVLFGRRGLLRGDAAAAARGRAFGRFRKGAQSLWEGAADPSSQGEDALFLLFSRFIAERFGLPRSGALAGEVGGNLREAGVKDDLARKAEAFFSRLEERRFGRGAGGEEAPFRDLIEEALGLAERLDKEASP